MTGYETEAENLIVNSSRRSTYRRHINHRRECKKVGTDVEQIKNIFYFTTPGCISKNAQRLPIREKDQNPGMRLV